jgi:hypothetical protein
MTKSLVALALALVVATPLLRAQEWGSPLKPEHEHLKLFAGHWEVEVKNLEAKDQPVVRVRESSELVCNGLFVRSTIRGEVDGKTYEMCALFGYDPHEKKYVGFGARSDSHLPMTLSGTFDEATKTFKLEGRKPNADQKLVAFKCTYVVTGDDERKETIWRVGSDGDDVATVEITFKRAKDSGTPQPASAGPAFKSPRLLELAGAWKGSMKAEMPGMGAMECETDDTCTLVGGGRWLYTTSKADFGGMPSEMHQLLGVDETGKKVVSLWIDSFGGNFDRADGTFGEGKTWLLTGHTRDQEGGKKRYTEESVWKDADNRLLRWVIDGGEGEEKTKIEIAYTRKK